MATTDTSSFLEQPAALGDAATDPSRADAPAATPFVESLPTSDGDRTRA
jgi:hypothetical protein